jgi:hypothetical protein
LGDDGVYIDYGIFLDWHDRMLSASFCQFDENDACRYDITSSGNNLKVFSTVVHVISSLQAKFDILAMTAEGKNRQSLYTRMVKKVVPQWTVYKKADNDGLLSIYAVSPSISNKEITQMIFSDAKEHDHYYPIIPDELKNYELCKLQIERDPNLGIIDLPLPENNPTDPNWESLYIKLVKYAFSLKNFIVGNISIVPEKYRDYDICLAAVSANGNLISYVPETITRYEELFIIAMKQSTGAIRFLPPGLRQNDRLMHIYNDILQGRI